MTRNGFILGMAVTYSMLIFRMRDKFFFEHPVHMTERELYDIATSKGINAKAIVKGICLLGDRDGQKLNEDQVLYQLEKILKDAKDRASLWTGNREMVDFTSLDEQQFALLDAMEQRHFPLEDAEWDEKQAKLLEGMSPEQVCKLYHLLYQQTLKLKYMGLLRPEERGIMEGKFVDNYDTHTLDVETGETFVVRQDPLLPSNHAKFNTKVPNGPFPPEIKDFYEKRRAEGYEEFPKENPKAPGERRFIGDGDEYFPSMLEDSIWDYVSTLNWSDIDLVFSVCG